MILRVVNSRFYAMFLLLVLYGCGVHEAKGPPMVHYGQDICHQCGMIISDSRFTAACLITEDGQRIAVAFDDVGCLIHALSEDASIRSSECWIKDYDSQQWLNTELASFVQSGQIQTPMASGVLAVSNPQRATEIAQQYAGQAISFATLTGQADSNTN